MSNEEYDQNIVESLKNEFYTQQGLTPRASNQLLDRQAEKASLICQQLEVDPAIYVAAQLKHVGRLKGFKTLLPNQLATSSAADHVHKFRSIVNRGNTWAGVYKLQKQRLAQIIGRVQRTIEEILLDHNYDFDPWFRCLITRDKIPSVIKKYGQKAREQINNPELKGFLDGLAVTEKVVFDFTRIPEYKL